MHMFIFNTYFGVLYTPFSPCSS